MSEPAKTMTVEGGQPTGFSRAQVMRQMHLFLLCMPASIVLTLFLVLPMLGVLRASLLPGTRSFNAEGFSWDQYLRFFQDSYYPSVLFETFGYGLLCTLLCLVLGFPVGYSLARLPSAKRRWRMILIILPLTLSLVVVVFGWLVILGRNGLVNLLLVNLGLAEQPLLLLFNRTAVVIVLVQQFLPFMILSIMSVISQIDPVYEEAAAVLRANRLTTLRRVILPLAVPGIVVGCTLVFVLTISAFVTPKLIGGSRVQMIGSLIYEQVTVLLNWPFGAAMSFILLVVALTLTFLGGKLASMMILGRSSSHAQ